MKEAGLGIPSVVYKTKFAVLILMEGGSVIRKNIELNMPAGHQVLSLSPAAFCSLGCSSRRPSEDNCNTVTDHAEGKAVRIQPRLDVGIRIFTVGSHGGQVSSWSVVVVEQHERRHNGLEW